EAGRRVYREILEGFNDAEVLVEGEPPNDRNAGINLPNYDESHANKYITDSQSNFTDYLRPSNSPVSYRETLENLVDSYAKCKKTPEILELLSNEIGKHPR